MTAPDFIWARELPNGNSSWHDASSDPSMCEHKPFAPYIRRDPAVIAELPEVKALIAAAMQRAANLCRQLGDKHEWVDGAEALDLADSEILALIPTDHAAALDAVKAQAREECAKIADGYAKDPNCIMDRGDYWAAEIAAAIRAGKAQP